MARADVISELQQRGLISNVTSEDKLAAVLNEGKGIYIGFDPTAVSLHLGNYQQVNVLRLFNKYDVPVVAVLGGATGMIGDPSGKSSERVLQDRDAMVRNTAAIARQLEKFTNGKIVNNADFYKNMTVLDFLRNVGKNFAVNYMLAKEQVANRLESGISYTEFSYMILQSYDFFCLYKDHGVGIQGGGSDQWGNITAGVDFIRRTVGPDAAAAGITFNLLTKADGTKFGKSEKGAVFLDEKLTSPYEMYQFLLNQSDEDVARLLMALTILEIGAIKKIVADHAAAPAKRIGQRALAGEVVKAVHGERKLERVVAMSNMLFGDWEAGAIDADDLYGVAKSLGPFHADKSSYDIAELLVAVGAATSKREANDLLRANGVSVNGKLTNAAALHGTADAIGGRFSLIRKGKRSLYAVVWPEGGK